MPALDLPSAALTVPPSLLLPEERDERQVRRGAWSLRLSAGRLDDIRFGSARILRGVRVVVRDRDWNTLPTTSVETRLTDDGLEIAGTSADREGRVDWTLRVRFEESALEADLKAQVVRPFLRNRLGLIVLHGTHLAGLPFEARHSTGERESAMFPEVVAPHQPARDLAGLAWSADGVPVVLNFEGDVFEMEDQRNWTDASYKTYSTPLERPFPVQVREGETVRQSVRLECSGRPPAWEEPEERRVSTLRFGRVLHQLPEIRTSASSAPESERPPTVPALGLLVECNPRWTGWRRALRRALEDADGHPVDLRVVVSTPGDLRSVLDEVGDAPISRLAAFAAESHRSDAHRLDAVRFEARERGVEVVGGVRSHFTELNRGAEVLAGRSDSLAFSITPFMHDRSGHQLVESIGVQRTVIRDAASIAAGRRLHVGPITLGARFNAVSTSLASSGPDDVDAFGYGPHLVPGATDERQTAPALAAWVVGSIDALATEAVDTLAYFEQWGPRGLATAAGPTPACRVLEWAAELAQSPRIEVEAPGLVAVGALHHGECIVLLGNLSGEPVEIDAPGLSDWRSSAGGRASGGRLTPGEAARLVLADQRGGA